MDVNYFCFFVLWEAGLSPGRGVMPVEVKDALLIMIGFGSLIIALLGLIVTIMALILRKEK